MPDPNCPCTTCTHRWSQHSSLGCHAPDCDCHYYSVSEPGLTSLPKRPTKEEALPHTMDPPKPLTAEELDRLGTESVYGPNHEWDENHLEFSHEEWCHIKASFDAHKRHAEDLRTALAEVVGAVRSAEAKEGECLCCGSGRPSVPHLIWHDNGISEPCQFSHDIHQAEKALEPKP